ncbi:MAG: hypothetical protein RLZZ337_720 [Bacteroidota bacterium]|jgi:effector-binding domain-containing protein
MKILKVILYFILILIGTLLLAALFAPGTKVIERQTEINAPLGAVFNQVANFENWQNWDPWFKLDTAQQRNYTGKQGDVEYGYSWTSDNDNVGNGSMKVIGFKDQEQIDYHLSFGDGGGSNEADGYFKFSELNGVTTVTWAMVSDLNYPFKFLNYFMEKMLAPDFEKGLANLKSYTEINPEVPLKMNSNVEIISEHGVNYAIVKSEKLPWAAMDSFYKTSYAPIYNYLRENGLEPKGPARSLFFTWNEEVQNTTLAAAVPISELVISEPEKVELAIGAAEVTANSISYLQKGDYDQSEKNHTALGDWITSNGKKIVYPVIEEYIKGPTNTSDSTQYETRLYYYFE